jgi:hypothetical protein
MEHLLSFPEDRVFVKDLSSLFDFKHLELAYNKSKFNYNVKNKISEDLRVLDSSESLLELKKICEEQATWFFKFDYYNSFDQLVVTTSWFNHTMKDQYHHKHSHPFSVLSGIIYLDDNPENLNLNFWRKGKNIPYAENNGVDRIGLTGLFNINKTPIQSNLKNHLILFTSNTYHDVSKVKDEKKARRSLAFNTFFKGIVGNPGNPLGHITYNIS